MIDVHTHILPYMDDGAEDWDEALSMAELAVKSGVTALVATPHCAMEGRYGTERADRMESQLSRFRERLEEASIPLAVCPGMEIFGLGPVARGLERGELTTLNGSRYPLIEFPFEGFARQATGVLAEVLAAGYRPVVAHPERYQYVQQDPALLNVWADMGCLLQINRGSLLGRFGPVEQELSLSMVDRGFVCAVASDAHSSRQRTPWMRDVCTLLEEEFSPELAELLLTRRPAALLEDQTMHIPEPVWF